jgi:hypothetical protein
MVVDIGVRVQGTRLQTQAVTRVFRNDLRDVTFEFSLGRLEIMSTIDGVCIPKEAVKDPGLESRRRMNDNPSINSCIHPTISSMILHSCCENKKNGAVPQY